MNDIKSIDDLAGIVESFNKAGKKVILRGQAEDKPLKPQIGREAYCLMAEKEIFESFKEERLSCCKKVNTDDVSHPKNDYDWLVLAQHYGCKTRCLDWTQWNDVALFFAVGDAIDKNGVVWIYELPSNNSAEWLCLGHPDLNKSPFQLKEIKIYHPSLLLDYRPTTQGALLTLHPSPGEPITMDNRRMFKLKVPADSKKNIKCDLVNRGINEARLFGAGEETL